MNIAIVTGASSGMGREFVRQLHHYIQPDEIWAIARRKTALEELASEIREKIKSGASGAYDQIIAKVKESKYYNALPEKIISIIDLKLTLSANEIIC